MAAIAFSTIGSTQGRLIRSTRRRRADSAAAQIGYNWQTGSVFGPIVFGVEADIQGAGLSDDRTNLFLGGITTTYGQKLDWFGTARGRIGIANGPVLSYVTAGYAFGNVKTNATQSVRGLTSTFSTDRTQSGWVVGSGVEAALGGNWTGKIEYLYLNLGNKTDATTLLLRPRSTPKFAKTSFGSV